MKESKLIKLLKTFSKADIKALQNVVKSPYFRKGRDLSAFFDSIRMFHPDFNHENFNNEFLFKKLYPGEKYNSKRAGNQINVLLSELFNIGKEYLIQKALNEDPARRKFYLLNKLREHNMYSEFEKEYLTVKEELENEFKGNANYFLNKYYLDQALLEYYIEIRKTDKVFELLADNADDLAIAALIQGFRIPDFRSTGIKSYSFDLKQHVCDFLTEAVSNTGFIDKVKNNFPALLPYIDLNYGIFKMFTEPDDTGHFFYVKNLIVKYMSYFGKSELYLISCIMSSYCIEKTRLVQYESFLKEEFELIKMFLDRGVYKYTANDNFNLIRFRGIVLSAFDLKEYDWLEDFIYKYSGELNKPDSENMKNYSLGYLYFGKKEFGKALEFFTKVKYEFFIFKLDVRHLLLEIHYELGHYDSAYPMLDAAKHYVAGTNDLTDTFKTREVNFFKYYNELLKAKTSSGKTDTGLLLKNLDKETHISSGSWLREKIKEL